MSIKKIATSAAAVIAAASIAVVATPTQSDAAFMNLHSVRKCTKSMKKVFNARISGDSKKINIIGCAGLTDAQMTRITNKVAISIANRVNH